jgi:hypothetical protein
MTGSSAKSNIATRDRAIKVINFEQTAAYQGAQIALALGRGLPCLVHF